MLRGCRNCGKYEPEEQMVVRGKRRYYLCQRCEAARKEGEARRASKGADKPIREAQ